MTDKLKLLKPLSSIVRREKATWFAFLLAVVSELILQSPNIGRVGSYGPLTWVMLVVLFGVMLWAATSVVHHAEVLAHRLGEPAGTLILTLSASGVEVLMMTTIALTGNPDPQIVKDTIYSTIMILLSGLTGVALLLGGLAHGEQQFNRKASKSYQSVLLGMVGVSLFLPTLAGEVVMDRIHWFIVPAFLVLYAVFLKLQIGRHSMFFREPSTSEHAKPASVNSTAYHAIMLLVTIASVVIVSEFFAVGLDEVTEQHNLPVALKGLVVALVIVGPEGMTAIRAARHNELQRSINILLGSALTTIALAIPAMLLVGQWKKINFGFVLEPLQAMLLLITLGVMHITESEGSTNTLDGVLQLMLFAVFVFFTLTGR